ncbi:MAG: flotillin family protein [Candidatus Thermoplasmatota archaeon]
MASFDVVLVVLADVIVIVFVLVIYASRYKRVPPNKAMVVYGRALEGGRGFKVYSGGGRWIRPIIETYEFLSLEPFPVELDLDRVAVDVGNPPRQFVPVVVRANARISGDPDLLRTAASQLLHKSPEEQSRLVGAVLEGHTRSVFASSPRGASDIAVAETVRMAAEADLSKVGIVLVGNVVIRRMEAAGPLDVAVPRGIVEEMNALTRRVQRIEERLRIARP